MSVRSARDAYLAENGFSAAAYDFNWTKASFFGIPVAVPNTSRHRWAIMLHDLHHVATGFGTDQIGESEISAWELRLGLRRVGPYVGSIISVLAAVGFLLYRRRAQAAWRAAGGASSLFSRADAYERLLDMTVLELRTELGVGPTGVADVPRGLHPRAPFRARTDGARRTLRSLAP
jgi:hypothetical protein